MAQAAAREFVDSQPNGTQMGLVVFSGFAELAVPPTTDRSALDDAINNLSTSPGTAIGAAILKSLDAIAEVDPQVQPVGNAVSTAAAARPASGRCGDRQRRAPEPARRSAKPPKGGYVPDIIVLLTDGANNRGITPLQAVPYAVARRVRIYTIGFGTTHPGTARVHAAAAGRLCGQWRLRPCGGFGGGGYGGGRYGGGGFGIPGGSRWWPTCPPLRQVSQLTGGASYTAQDASAAQQGVRQPAQARRRPEGAPRGHGDLRPHRRASGPHRASGRRSGPGPTPRSSGLPRQHPRPGLQNSRRRALAPRPGCGS